MTPVDFLFLTPAGLPVANAAVEIQLAKPAFGPIESGILLPRPILTVTDAAGKVTVSLKSVPEMYFVRVEDGASDSGLFYKFYVPVLPTGVTSVRLQDIVVTVENANPDFTEATLATFLSLKISAVAAKIAAEDAKAAAAASAVLAGSYTAANAASVSAVNATVTSAANNAALASASATSAANSSTAGAGSATTATAQAVIATAQAADATAKAVLATTNAATTTAQAAIAVTNAGVATTQAGIAITNAGTATTQAGNAAASATGAAGSAGTATTKASNANASATAAATSAANALASALASAASAADSAAGVAVSSATATVSAAAAAASATASATSATAAAASATAAATSATGAAASKTGADNSASAAATSKTGADTSASNAAASLSNALNIYGSISAVNTAATNASASAAGAATSKTGADTSASNAATSAANAATSATGAAASKTSTDTSAANAATSATGAAASATSATASASAAATSASGAATSKTGADTSAASAGTSATSATASATSATASAAGAATSKTGADASAASATTSATNAGASATAAASSATGAATSKTGADASAASATTSATNAATSATGAATSKTGADTSATNAAASATGAAASKTGADTSATNAAASAAGAATSKTGADASAASATTSATNASASATGAATSAAGAATSKTGADTSAANAATSATSSATSATGSAASKTAADTSATNAAASAAGAATSKTGADTSATNAAASASGAATSATNSAASATASATSKTGSDTSAAAAATSATGASTSATNAATSATGAATSKTGADASAASATSSATSATASATSATASATGAATSKTGADTSATNAASSATSAATSATGAATSKTGSDTSATNAAASATAATSQANLAAGYAATASSAVQQDLSGVTAQALHRSPNAVTGMFIYDTSKDSDGGAWRKRTNNLSWFSETLNGRYLGSQATEAAARAVTGATTGDYFQLTTDGKFYSLNVTSGLTEVFRGNKAEFPALCAIVSEATSVTIYDLTDTTRAMWMRFVQGVNMAWGSTAFPATSVFAMQGSVFVGCSDGSTYGTLMGLEFLKDKISRVRSTNGPFSGDVGPISVRNTTLFGTLAYQTSQLLGNERVSAVAMTVLPDAPIDGVTGLQTPTVSVATGGGVSVIQNTGTVVNSASAVAATKVVMDKDSIFWLTAAGALWAAKPGSLGAAFTNSAYTTSAAPALLGAPTSLAGGQTKATASVSGVTLLRDNRSTAGSGLVASISSAYNTGYMVGDIRRVYMADASAGSVVNPSTVADRSYKAAAATVFGTLTKTAVATASQMVAYSGFGSVNYVREPYSADLDFGTGAWRVSAWANLPASTSDNSLGQTTRNWQGMATLGSDVYASAYNADIYKQTGGVGNFVALGLASKGWHGMATFGSNVYASAFTEDIYKQTGGTGTFVALGQTFRRWFGMAATSTDVYACTNNDDIFKQTGGVGNFVALGEPFRGWYGMAALGSDVYACVYGGDIYKQTGGTGSFVALGQTARNWYGMTASGTDVYASVDGGDIYKQTGGTGAFVALGLTTGRSIFGMTVSSAALYASTGTDIFKFYPNNQTLASREAATGPSIKLQLTVTGFLKAIAFDGTTTRTVTSPTAVYNTANWLKAVVDYATDGALTLKVNGVQIAQTTGAPLLTMNSATAVTTIGNSFALNEAFGGSLALLKVTSTLPTAEQATFMYEQEKLMFRAGAQVALPDSGAITDLTYDELTDKWVVVSATNESSFKGLVRTSTAAVSAGAFSRAESKSGLKLLARSTTTPGVDITMPAYGLREELVRRAEAAAAVSKTLQVFDFDAVAAQTDFVLPVGWTAIAVLNAGASKREGATKDWVRLFDGFKETVRFAVAPGAAVWTSIKAKKA